MEQDILLMVTQMLEDKHASKDQIALGFRFGIELISYLSLNNGQFSNDLRSYLRDQRHSTSFSVDGFVTGIENVTRKDMPNDLVVWLKTFTYQNEMPEFVNAVLTIYERLFESVALIRRWNLVDSQDEKLKIYFAPILEKIDQLVGK